MTVDDTLTRIERRLGRQLAPPAAPLVPLKVGHAVAGWLTADRARRLEAFRDVFRMNSDALAFVPALEDPDARTRALAGVAAELARAGALTAWRDERYAVRAAFDAPPWFLLERAAARFFGVHTYAAHVNGLVGEGPAASMWVARRSRTKAIDPGMLDNLVGGGIAEGASVSATVVKESWEEAGIPADVASRAVLQATLTIFREQPDGIQRETVYAHDLSLPPDFTPANQDGEAVAHRLVPLHEVASLLAQDSGEDVVTADASLVALDCLLRHAAISPRSTHAPALARFGHANPVC